MCFIVHAVRFRSQIHFEVTCPLSVVQLAVGNAMKLPSQVASLLSLACTALFSKTVIDP